MAGTDPVRVTFVSSYGRLGGSEIYLERLLDRIPAASITQVVSLGEGPLIDRLSTNGIPVETIDTSGRARSIVASARRLRQRLVTERPDVVHANGLKAAIAVALATFGTGLPAIWVKHDFAMDGWRAQILARRFRIVVGVSRALLTTFGTREDRFRVVHTGIEAGGVEESGGADLATLCDAPADARIVGLIGHLIPGKGHLELLAVARGVLAEVPEARFAFIGGAPSEGFGDYVEGLERMIRHLDLEPVVKLLGHRDDVAALLPGCRVVVIPSVAKEGADTEGFPLVALEAMSAGTAIVGYEVGGLPELVGGCGLLVDRGDRAALERSLIDVLRDDSLRARLVECGRERVQQRFSSDQMVSSMMELYEEAAV